MDQTELEDQVIPRNKQECGDDTNLDSTVCLLASGVSEVCIKNEEIVATNSKAVADQSV